MTLISEMKRRNIFRVAVLYVVAGWLLLQLAYLLSGVMGADWVYRFLFGILVICFPLILVFSYIFEITPEGLKKEHEVLREESITRQTGKRINHAIGFSAAAAVVVYVARIVLG